MLYFCKRCGCSLFQQRFNFGEEPAMIVLSIHYSYCSQISSSNVLVFITAPGSSRAIQALHSANLNTGANNYTKMLEDLAKEKKFDIRYLDLAAKSYSGKKQFVL